MSNNLFNVFEKQLGYKFMKPHKWAKEIKAWADGAEIEHRWIDRKKNDDWDLIEPNHDWTLDCFEYRIKPQPKEPQYLYVYVKSNGEIIFAERQVDTVHKMVGKIKLEQENE